MARGVLITFEGTDGSGKTTQINALNEYFMEKGYNTSMFREPGGTRIGEQIRDLLLSNDHVEMSAMTEMLLYAASRAQITDEFVKPLLNSGTIVILDRFFDSSLAYQAYGRGLDFESVLDINLAAVQNIVPDITFFIDISPEQSLQRKKVVAQADRLENESLEFHDKVYEGYLKLLERFSERIIRIDGTLPPDEISKKIIDYTKQILKEA